MAGLTRQGLRDLGLPTNGKHKGRIYVQHNHEWMDSADECAACYYGYGFTEGECRCRVVCRICGAIG